AAGRGCAWRRRRGRGGRRGRLCGSIPGGGGAAPGGGPGAAASGGAGGGGAAAAFHWGAGGRGRRGGAGDLRLAGPRRGRGRAGGALLRARAAPELRDGGRRAGDGLATRAGVDRGRVADLLGGRRAAGRHRLPAEQPRGARILPRVSRRGARLPGRHARRSLTARPGRSKPRARRISSPRPVRFIGSLAHRRRLKKTGTGIANRGQPEQKSQAVPGDLSPVPVFLLKIVTVRSMAFVTERVYSLQRRRNGPVTAARRNDIIPRCAMSRPRRLLFLALPASVAALAGCATGPSSSSSLLADGMPAPGVRCTVASLPAALPSPDALVDDAF